MGLKSQRSGAVEQEDQKLKVILFYIPSVRLARDTRDTLFFFFLKEKGNESCWCLGMATQTIMYVHHSQLTENILLNGYRKTEHPG